MFKDQSLHFPHDMRGNATIPRKAYRIEPEFAFAFRTANVDMGRLCALVGVEVKPKSAYSEYCGHVIRVLPLEHAGKFCCGRGGDVTASPLDNAMCHAMPSLASPALRRFLRHIEAKPPYSLGETSIWNHHSRGVWLVSAGAGTGCTGTVLRVWNDFLEGRPLGPPRHLSLGASSAAGNRAASTKPALSFRVKPGSRGRTSSTSSSSCVPESVPVRSLIPGFLRHYRVCRA